MDFKDQHTRSAAEVEDAYPERRVEEKNPRYAQLLMQDLSSASGESSAIHQYLYQSWIVEPIDSALAQTLRSISFVEMRHYDMIGKLICLLGGDPRLCVCRQGRLFYWNGRMVDYTHCVSMMLKQNIQAERTAARRYREQAKQISDPLLAAVLHRIAQDEELHLSIFQECLRKTSQST